MNRTSEFIVTTFGGISSGSTISARSNSTSKSFFEGNAFIGNDSNNSSSLSTSREDMMIRGLVFIFHLFLQCRFSLLDNCVARKYFSPAAFLSPTIQWFRYSCYHGMYRPEATLASMLILAPTSLSIPRMQVPSSVSIIPDSIMLQYTSSGSQAKLNSTILMFFPNRE